MVNFKVSYVDLWQMMGKGLNRNLLQNFSKAKTLKCIVSKHLKQQSLLKSLLERYKIYPNKANWIDELSRCSKRDINNIHTSTKMTPVNASKTSVEKEVVNKKNLNAKK